MDIKKCSKCKIDKNINDFYKNISTKSGIYSICKNCKKEIQRFKNKPYDKIMIPCYTCGTYVSVKHYAEHKRQNNHIANEKKRIEKILIENI